MLNSELSGALTSDALARHMGTVIAVRDIEGQKKQSFHAEPPLNSALLFQVTVPRWRMNLPCSMPSHAITVP